MEEEDSKRDFGQVDGTCLTELFNTNTITTLFKHFAWTWTEVDIR